MILETIVLGPIEVNCYILASKEGSAAIIIDPGAEPRKIRRMLDKHDLKPALVINTHGHFDHIGADDAFGVPVYVHTKDAPLLREPGKNLSGLFALPYSVKSEIREIEEGKIISLDDIELEVIHLPGHTPGGIGLRMRKPANNIVFSGDTLFCQGIGRTDLEGANTELLLFSIKEKLFKLSDDTAVYPGHGPSTTIGDERRGNPFV